MDNIILVSIGKDELRELIRSAVKSELHSKQDKRLLSFKETREFLGVSASTLNKWKSANQIPYKKLGKRIFFEKDEVIKALEDSRYSKMRELE